MPLVDVARVAGVSVATASRVLGGSDHPVSSDTRKRVLQAAAELGYSPSAVARALVTKQTKIVGVIVGDVVDPYFSAIARGIEDVSREHGYLAIICNSDRDPEIEWHYVRVLRDYRVDGLIFAGGGLENPEHLARLEPMLAEMARRSVPTVGIGEHPSVSLRVRVDNDLATREMTEHILALGHRQIAYIKGPSGLTTSSIRLEAYCQTLKKNGLQPDPGLVVEGDFTFEGGYEGTTYLFESGRHPTAIFAANDQMAIGALVAAQQRGLRVPQDLTVVGFDDIPAAEYVYPPLTTVRVPMYEMGVTAMQALIALMAGQESSRLHVLNHRLAIRGSSGPAPRTQERPRQQESRLEAS